MPVGAARLVVCVGERLKPGRLVVRCIGHQLVPPERARAPGAGGPAVVGVAADGQLPAQVVAERLGHDVDHAGDGLGPIEEPLAAFQDLDPVDHVRWNGVERRSGVVEAVRDAHPVDEIEDLAAARALQGGVEVVERAAAGRQIESRHGHHEGAGHVDEPAGLQLARGHFGEPVAISAELRWEGFLQPPGHHDRLRVGHGRLDGLSLRLIRQG